MTQDSGISESLGELSRQARSQTEDIDHSPFSPEAFDSLHGTIANYISSLVHESYVDAKRRRSDIISADNIRVAELQKTLRLAR